MPYMYSEDGLCVHKKNPDGSMGESMGCSKTRAEAEKHMAALMAAMHGEGKKVGDVDENGAVTIAEFSEEEFTVENVLIAMGTEIKDLGNGKLGGYLVRFTTPEDPDLTGDFFDAKSDIHV